MFKHEDPWSESPIRELLRQLEELARQIGLRSGYLRITITEGHAAKIEASQYTRTWCTEHKTTQWEFPSDPSKLSLREVPKLVVTELEHPIVQMLGKFGYVEPHFADGRISRILIEPKFLPSRKTLPT